MHLGHIHRLALGHLQMMHLMRSQHHDAHKPQRANLLTSAGLLVVIMTLPTDPARIDALVRGTSVRLKVLDEVGGETLDQAA